jgi:Flp pilus assembly protein protease CpaA
LRLILALAFLFPALVLAQPKRIVSTTPSITEMLFALGLGFWLAGLVGAGDAKLMLLCGLFTGLDHLGHFAIGLLVATLAFYAAMKAAQLPRVEVLLVFARLKTFGGLGKVPYGVPLSAGAIYAFLMRGI